MAGPWEQFKQTPTATAEAPPWEQFKPDFSDVKGTPAPSAFSRNLDALGLGNVKPADRLVAALGIDGKVKIKNAGIETERMRAVRRAKNVGSVMGGPAESGDIDRSWAEMGSDAIDSLHAGAVNVAGGALEIANLPQHVINAANSVPNAYLRMMGDDYQIPSLGGYDWVRGTQAQLTDEGRAIREGMSPKALAQAQELQQADGFAGTVEQLATNPSQALMQALEQIPQLAGLATPGGVAAKLAGSGVLAGGQMGDQVSHANQLRVESGEITQDEANKMTSQAAIASAIINTLLQQVVPGGQTLEQAAVSTLGRKSIAGKTGSRLTNAGLGAFGEGVTGIAEEGGDQISQNLATGRPVSEGVGQSAALGALLQGPLGAFAGAKLDRAPTNDIATELLQALAPVSDQSASQPSRQGDAAPAGGIQDPLAETVQRAIAEMAMKAQVEQARGAVAEAAAPVAAAPVAAAPVAAEAVAPVVDAVAPAVAEPEAVVEEPAKPTATPEQLTRRDELLDEKSSHEATRPAKLKRNATPEQFASYDEREAAWVEKRNAINKELRPLNKLVGPAPVAEKPIPDLMDYLARAGLNREAWVAQGVDPKAQEWRGLNPVFRKGDAGLTPDGLREQLQQDGYLEQDPVDGQPVVSDNDAIDLVMSALAGNKHYSIDQADAVAEQEMRKRADEELFQQEQQSAALVDLHPDIDETDYDAVNDMLAAASALRESGMSEDDVAERIIQEQGNGTDEQANTASDPVAVRGQADGTAQLPGSPATGLFGAPTAREQAEGLSRARDDKRNGKTGGVTPTFSGTDLGAGAAPVQTDVEDAAPPPAATVDIKQYAGKIVTLEVDVDGIPTTLRGDAGVLLRKAQKRIVNLEQLARCLAA